MGGLSLMQKAVPSDRVVQHQFIGYLLTTYLPFLRLQAGHATVNEMARPLNIGTSV